MSGELVLPLRAPFDKLRVTEGEASAAEVYCGLLLQRFSVGRYRDP